MTTQTLGATVAFPGTNESQAALRALAQVVSGLAGNIGQLQAAETSETQATTQSANAHQQQAQAQGQAGQAAVQFGQRIAGVANAVQSLVSRLGSRDQTAGLVGSIASTTAQFASMGAALGPQGAVGGAIVGFTASIYELAHAHSAAAEAARDQQNAEAHLAEARAQAASARALAGGGTDADAQAQIQRHYETIARAQEQIRQLEAVGTGDASTADYWLGTLQQLEQMIDTGRGTTREMQIQRLHDEVSQAQDAIDQLNSVTQDATGLGGLGGHEQGFTPRGFTAPTEGGAGPHRPGGGGGRQSPEEQEQERLLDLLEQTNETRRLGAQLAEEYSQHTQEGTKAEAEAERAYQAQLRATQRQEEEADRARHKGIQQAMRDEDDRKRKLQQEAQQRQQEGQQATGAIISDLTNVFSIMAQGQMDAAHGAEMLLAAFLQYISQRATIEALAQVAQALGSYPDFGGMALHFAAAAGWAAVAIATGVGGAALASDAQSKGAAAQSQAQSQPSSPQPHSGNEKGGGNTYVINWNAPVVTAQTEAQLGRGVRRIVDRAAQRFPGG